jgi:hypothetical protein
VSVLTGLLTAFTNRIADKIADQAILIIRKKLKMGEIDKGAEALKQEVKSAISSAEKEAVLDKVHDLINSLD